MSAILEVKNLRVGVKRKEGPVPILDDVTFSVKEGEIVALVGESGCGKSMTALAIMGLLNRKTLEIMSGEIYLQGRPISRLSQKEYNKLRGKELSMIFQEPMTSLNPSYTIGNQLEEVLRLHTDYSPKEIKEKAVEALAQVKIPDPHAKVKAYPHELSGGMRQRVMIAMALAAKPKVLIADEPTTALDVTIQAQILDLLLELQEEYGLTIIMITHDLGVVAETCQRAIVMYAGQIVEEGNVEEMFENPKHPYTIGLLESSPKLHQPKEKLHVIRGMVPDIANMPKGCRFNPRCDFATEICISQPPQLEDRGNERRVRCWVAQ